MSSHRPDGGSALPCRRLRARRAASPAVAQDAPISGFTADTPPHQRAYEAAFTGGVSAGEHRPYEPPAVAPAAADRHARRAPVASRSRSTSCARYGLDVAAPATPSTRRGRSDIGVTMTAPAGGASSPPRSGRFPWQQRFDEVVEGYNAYSPSGDVTGDVVYANYGLPAGLRGARGARRQRRGQDRARPLRRLVPRRQGAAGGAARREGRDHLLRPSRRRLREGRRSTRTGRGGPADGIQRGSIQYIFNYPGDPLTPGAPAVPGTPRLSPDDAENLPRIPTTPISYGEAQPLLETLTGPEAPGVVPRRTPDHLPGRAGRHAGAARPRHRLRADAGVAT